MWWSGWARAYEISIPGVDLWEMSRVNALTGVTSRRSARKRDEVGPAENIECALYTTWAGGAWHARNVFCTPESVCKVQSCVHSVDSIRVSRCASPLAIWINGASKA